MKLQKPGTGTLKVEVLNISKNGIWLFVEPKEYFLPYKQFPWFEKAKVSDICKVSFAHRQHLRWKTLDIDLQLDSLEHPERYPLQYKYTS